MKQLAAAIALGTLLFPALVMAQAPARSAAAAQLRRDYYAQDPSRIAEDAKPLLKQHPKDLELRAWYVVGVYGTDRDEIAEQMKQISSASPWTLLAAAATAGFENTLDTKLDLCEKAIAGSGDNPDVLVLATAILRQAALFESNFQHPANADALKAFLGKYRSEYKRSANGLAAQAQSLGTVAQIEKDAKSTAAVRLAGRVLKSDPTNVAALLLKSQALVKKRDYQANYELLKPAARAVADSYPLHLAYWQAVLALPNAKPAEQKQEIEADAARIISAGKPSTQFAEYNLRQLDTGLPGLGTAIGDMLLERYPHTAVEDGVLLGRALASDSETNEGRDAQVAALESFLDRPQHDDTNLVNLANYELAYDLSSQENPDLDRLYRAELALASATGSEYPPLAAGVTRLADRKVHLPKLESLARTQLDAQWTRLQTDVKQVAGSELKSFLPRVLQSGPGGWLDALGWVELQEGKLDAALPELEDASKLSPQDPQIAIHVGTAYEAKGDGAKAEKTFRDALAMQYLGQGDDPALAALRELYIHTHGSASGVEDFMQPILVQDAARRKAAILAGRFNPETPLESFELASLGGKEVSSGGLKGKYLVLNFWATW